MTTALTHAALAATGALALLLSAGSASAQTSDAQPRRLGLLITGGAFVPTGAQRHVLGDAHLSAAQLSWRVRPSLAVTGTFEGSGPAFVLGAAVGLWIGGFDLIYACQDAEVDPQIGVRSVPARYGVPFALALSTVVHVVTFGLFVWFGALVDLEWLWWVGLVLTAVAFAYEHAIVKATDLSRVNRAFFTANGFVGIALFVFALADLVTRSAF